MKITSAVLLASICVIVACSSSDKSPTPLTPIDGAVALRDSSLTDVRDEIIAMIDNSEAVSFSVAVAKDGEVIWAESFGFADREAGRLATPDTPYLLGSMSKSISAAALMTLVDEGSLGLKDRVNEIIAPNRLTGYGALDADAATVEHILHSSAGVPHGSYSTADPAQLPDQLELLPWSGMVVFPPGEVWEYSNFSFGLTEVVAEAVSGLDYESFIKRNLFDPLGMNDASARYVDQMEETSAIRYSASLNRLTSRGGAVPFGGLGMFASVNDLLSFGMYQITLDASTPLTRESLDIMHSYDGLSDIFGLGWYNTNKSLVSNGSVGGGNSHLMVHPEENLVVVVLTNMTSRNAITDQLADRIKNKYVAPLPLEEQYTYEKYAAIYENPYEPTPEFVGRWRGELQGPGLDALSAELVFDASGTVDLQLADSAYPLQWTVFNTKRIFGGSTTATFPPLFPHESGPSSASVRMRLLKSGESLTGYAQIDRGGTDYSYSVGVFARFDKIQ